MSDGAPFAGGLDAQAAAVLLANLNSFALDFVARSAVGGADLSFFIIKQLPVLEPVTLGQVCVWEPVLPYCSWIVPRVVELTYTATDLAPFARDLGNFGPPYVWDEERRFWLCAELDGAFFNLYDIARDDVDYIMDTFPIVKRKDIAAHGRYRTKEAILEIYDEMADAIRTGIPYQTRLNPPPANGWTPPPLPTLDDAVGRAGKPTISQSTQATTRPAPNLFEEPLPVLFDGDEGSGS